MKRHYIKPEARHTRCHLPLFLCLSGTEEEKLPFNDDTFADPDEEIL